MLTTFYLKAYARLPRHVHAWHGLLTLVFLLLLVAGSSLLRGTGGGMPEPDASYMGLVNPELQVIYAGSSHIGYGIDPRLYSLSGMNITAGALNYEGMEIILGKYLDRASHLQALVIEADIVPLRVDTMARLDGDYRSLYRLGLGTFDLPIGGYRKLMQWARESWLLYPVYFMERWSPSLLIWGRRPLGGEGEAKRATRGYTALDRVISEKSDGRVVAEIHRLDHLRTDHADANLPALLRMIAMAQARDIPVVMLRLPHHPTYVQHRTPEWEEQVQDMLARVRETAHPEGIHYLDWEERPEFLMSILPMATT